MSSSGWQIDRAAAENALATLLSAKSVCLPTHQNVDADGISSALAILEGLRRKGGNGFVVISDGKLPRYLTFLPGSESVVIYGKDELPEFDMLCLVDCSDQRRLGKFYTDDPARIDGAHANRQHRSPCNQSELRRGQHRGARARRPRRKS